MLSCLSGSRKTGEKGNLFFSLLRATTLSLSFSFFSFYESPHFLALHSFFLLYRAREGVWTHTLSLSILLSLLARSLPLCHSPSPPSLTFLSLSLFLSLLTHSVARLIVRSLSLMYEKQHSDNVSWSTKGIPRIGRCNETGNATPVYHGVDWVPTSAGQILIVAFSGAQALIELRLLGMGRYVSKRGVDPLLSTDRLFIAGWATKTPIPITLYILPIFFAYPSPSFFFFFLFSFFSFFLSLFSKGKIKGQSSVHLYGSIFDTRVPRIASNVIVVTL